ncbi:MAG: FG-GAP-like repeat-containing protein, partial [Planctomycetota bacterium JB042]
LSDLVVGKHSWLGESFAVAGDVDGDGDDELAAVQRKLGEVWVFEGGAAKMALPPDWKSDPSPATKSVRVAGAGDVDGDGYADLAVGRPEPGGPGAGFVEIHRGSADGPTNPAAWTVAGIESGEEFGLALDGVGDVNADGFQDVVVGAPAHKDDHGRAVLFLGSPAGLVSTPAWQVEGKQSGMRLGAAVSGAGDLNADGFDDVLIGAPDHDGEAKDTGRVRLYHGSAHGLESNPAWVHDGPKKKMKFGFAVAGLSDVDADGFTDVAVGAPLYTKGQSTEGRVLVFLGQGGNPSDTADWKWDGNAVGHNLGHDVSDGGDVDGDGFAELVVGAPSHDSPDFSPWYDLGNKGPRVTVWFGSPGGPGESFVLIGGDTYAEDFAAAVAGGGDFDGDGRADVAVGWEDAGLYDGESNWGRIVVLDSADVAPDVASPRLRRLDDSAPVVAGGLATAGGFRARLDARNPFGAAPVAIEVEVKPVGVPFDGVATVVGPFVDVASAPVPIEAIVDGLPDGAWRWRARPRFATHLVPWAAPGVWRSPPFNGSTRPHVRTGPPFCADLAASFAYGAGKAGGAGVPVLASEPIPRLGEDVVLTVANGTSGLAPSLLVGVAAASVPFDGGTLHVQPAWVVPLPAFPADGSLVVPLSIPVDQALCGESVFFQVLFVDPAAGGALKTAQSNGLAWTIGI